MAKVKASTKKKTEKENIKEEKEKKVGIFDLLSYITDQKKPWNDLTDEEKKIFNPYMINKFLSMDLFLVEALNDLQKYTLSIMDKKDVYNLLLKLLPQQKLYLKYIKGKNDLPEDDINILIKYFGLSRREVEDYYLILEKTTMGKDFIKKTKESYVYE